jgi:hypothetical protein
LASHGCHASGGWLGGAIVGGAVLVGFMVVGVSLWRKPGTQSQDVGIVGLAQSGSVASVQQVIKALQSGQTNVVVSSSDRASGPVSAEATVQRRAKLEELHRRGALTDEEFAQQLSVLQSEP